jgi:hypothetical protein
MVDGRHHRVLAVAVIDEQPLDRSVARQAVGRVDRLQRGGGV